MVLETPEMVRVVNTRKGFKNRVIQLKALRSKPLRFKSMTPPSTLWAIPYRGFSN